jgi:hypothetical protein
MDGPSWSGRSRPSFGTKGLVKVDAVIDGVPAATAFMATGDGRQMLPVNAAVRRAIGKEAPCEGRTAIQAPLSSVVRATLRRATKPHAVTGL